MPSRKAMRDEAPTMMPARVAGVMGFDGEVRWSWVPGLGRDGVEVMEGSEADVGREVDVEEAEIRSGDGGVLSGGGGNVDVDPGVVAGNDGVGNSDVRTGTKVAMAGCPCDAGGDITSTGSLPVLPN